MTENTNAVYRMMISNTLHQIDCSINQINSLIKGCPLLTNSIGGTIIEDLYDSRDALLHVSNDLRHIQESLSNLD